MRCKIAAGLSVCPETHAACVMSTEQSDSIATGLAVNCHRNLSAGGLNAGAILLNLNKMKFLFLCWIFSSACVSTVGSFLSLLDLDEAQFDGTCTWNQEQFSARHGKSGGILLGIPAVQPCNWQWKREFSVCLRLISEAPSGSRSEDTADEVFFRLSTNCC